MGTVVHLQGSGRALARAEREFLPATLELLETPPSPTVRLTAWTLVVLIGGALTWACLSEIEVVASAPGRIVPVGQVKVVQPLETSVVRAIHVAEGDHVSEGQVLIDLDPTDASADIESSRTERMQALLDAEAARVILSENEGEPFRNLADVEPALVASTVREVGLQIEEYRATVASLRDQVEEKRSALTANGVDAAKNAELLPLAVEKYQTQKGLFDRGNAAKPNLLQAQYEMIERQADQRSIPEQQHQIEADIHGLEHKIAETRATFLGKAADQRVKALQKVAMIDQTLRKAREREGLRHLVAPVAGTVGELKTHTAGGVVTTADQLLTIVPDGAALEVEALVDHKEIGFLHEGQVAEVKLDAFPFTRYGTAPGRVRLIAHNASDPTRPPPGRPESSPSLPGEGGYRVTIALDRESLDVDGVPVRLVPGMTAQADIKTGVRRVIGYVLDPVIEHATGAGKER